MDTFLEPQAFIRPQSGRSDLIKELTIQLTVLHIIAALVEAVFSRSHAET
jgi:hypothetical protein